MMENWNWDAISTVSTTILSTILVWATIRQGRNQQRAHKQNIELNLFDKRFAVFKTIKETLILVRKDDATLDSILSKDENNINRSFVDYNNKLLEMCSYSKFLFDQDIYDSIVKLTTLFDHLKRAYFDLQIHYIKVLATLSEEEKGRLSRICTENASDGLKMDTLAFNAFPEMECAANEWGQKVLDYLQFAEQSKLLDKIGVYLDLKSIE